MSKTLLYQQCDEQGGSYVFISGSKPNANYCEHKRVKSRSELRSFIVSFAAMYGLSKVTATGGANIMSEGGPKATFQVTILVE